MALNGLGLVALCGLLSAERSAATSSEADPLQQAFLLVDLLKTEYARVKGENTILRKRELKSRTSLDDLTCPPTEPSESSTSLDGRRAAVPHGNYLTHHPREPRKHIAKSRRLEYDDAFGPHPGGDNPNKADTDVATSTTSPGTSSTTTQKTTLRKTSTSVSSTMININDGTTKSIVQQLTTAGNTRKTPTTGKTKLYNPSKKLVTSKKPGATKMRLNYKKPSTKPTRDPIMEQVASEVSNEMKDSKTAKIKKYAVYSAPLLSAKTERLTRFDNFTRGAFRIHQATSKSYPIPLPENNAFCFFHPDSALCRTFI